MEPMEGIHDRGVEIASSTPAVTVKDLVFDYDLKMDSIKNQLTNKPALNGINVEIPSSARVLLVGMNGSGKSTLLNVLAGKVKIKNGSVKILDKDVFYDTSLNDDVAYVKPDEWGVAGFSQPPFSSTSGNLSIDLSVGEMMNSIQNEYKSRRDQLVNILQIDLKWRMNHLLNHERKKVALFLNLIKPFKILLLDESLGSLNVVIRKKLLSWLKKLSQESGCTIMYATQVISDLDEWPTHVIYLQLDGTIGWCGSLTSLYEGRTHPKDHMPSLQDICEEWFKDELGAIRVQVFSRSSSFNEETKGGEEMDQAVAETVLQPNRKKGLPIDAEYRTNMNQSNH